MKRWIYVHTELPEEGKQSLTLSSNGCSYFDNSKAGWHLNDGSPLEEKSYFTDEHLDLENKKLTGYIEYNKSPLYGCVKRECVITFSDDWKNVICMLQTITQTNGEKFTQNEYHGDYENKFVAFLLREELVEDSVVDFAI